MGRHSLLDDLGDMMPDTLVAKPGSTDGFGAWTASGTELSMPCLIEGENRLVRDNAGQEVVSSLQVIVGVTAALIEAWIALGWSGWIDAGWVSGDDAYPTILTTTGYRYDLPGRFPQRTDLKAIAIERASDEIGAHHEVVQFP